MKKLISLVLVLCMVLGLFHGMTLPVHGQTASPNSAAPTTPYHEHIITNAEPAVIPAVWFDPGTGYDTDINWGSRDVRPGEAPATEVGGSGFPGNIGYTSAGDWIQFTIHVADPGTYHLEVYSAIPGGTGDLRFYLNHKLAATFSNNQGTNWQEYTWGHAGTVDLEAGENLLVVYFVNGNINLAALRFTAEGLYEGPIHESPIVEQPPVLYAEPEWRTLYVATDGCDDTGNGSSQNPFASIAKAAREVTPGTTVLVREGIYYEHSIRPAVSGILGGMTVFRPASPTDEVIIRHRDYFTGENADRDELRRLTGWTEDQISHFDDQAVEYSIAAYHAQLTDVFDLATRDYIMIDGFTFSDYRFARMTIDIGGDGNVVTNNRFINIGTVHWGGDWHWWPTLKRGCVTLQVHGNYNVVRNNLFQSVYGEVISLGGNSAYNLVTENTFVGIIGKNTTWEGSESSLFGGRFHNNWHNVFAFNYAAGSQNGGMMWLDICVNDMIIVRNVAHNTAYLLFNESGCERNWVYENIAFNKPVDANRRMPESDLFTDFRAQRMESAYQSSFWYVGASWDARWINNVAYNVRNGLYIHRSFRDEMRNNIVFSDNTNQLMINAAAMRLSELALSGYLPECWADRRGSGPHILRNNIFYSATTENFIRYMDPIVSSYITVEQLMSLEDAPHTLAVDPMFVDPAAGDFRLREGSPAIGTGDNGVDRGAFAVYPQFDVGYNADLTLLADTHASFGSMITNISGGETVNLELRLNRSATREMRFEVAPVAGDARLDFDFHFPNGQIVTFNPGESVQTIPITILAGNPDHDRDQLVSFRIEPVDGSTVLEEVGPRNAHMFRVRRQTMFSLSINDSPMSARDPYTGLYYAEGDVVVVNVGTRPGFVFERWTGGYHDVKVELADEFSETTSFIMPNWNVTLRPIWRMEDDAVPLTAVQVDKPSLVMTAGTTASISATAEPSNATQQEFMWASTNPLVAQVDSNGTVTAVSPGMAFLAVRALQPGNNRTQARVAVRVEAADIPEADEDIEALPEPPPPISGPGDETDAVGPQDDAPDAPAPDDDGGGPSVVVIVVIIAAVLAVAAVGVGVVMKGKKKA